jgi:hypothetical protein
MFIKEDWDWRGPADGTFRFAVQQRDGTLHVAVETTDDRLVTDADQDALQDRILVTLQTGGGGETTAGAVAGALAKNLIAQPRPRRCGLIAQFALPLPPDAGDFRLNIGWIDVDRPENTKPSVLWWRTPGTPAFGRFNRTD